MKQDRWRRAEDRFHAAPERPPEARRAFLDEACGEDTELRRQVEMLVSKDEHAGSFLETPPLADVTATLGARGVLVGRQYGPVALRQRHRPLQGVSLATCRSSPRSEEPNVMTLDTRTASLIAVGASVSANCLPCVEINVTRALKCGASMQDVADAVDLGRRVRTGAAAKMDGFAAALNIPIADSPPPNTGKCGCGA